MYPFGPYQQPPAQKPPFLQQVLDYLPKNSPPTYGAGPFMQPPIQQTGGLVQSIAKMHKGLQVVQQVLPIWKQYAPLVKNAPMLIDMAKIMLSEDQVDEEDSKELYNEDQDESKKSDEKDLSDIEKSIKQRSKSKDKKDDFDGLPAPKLYI